MRLAMLAILCGSLLACGGGDKTGTTSAASMLGPGCYSGDRPGSWVRDLKGCGCSSADAPCADAGVYTASPTPLGSGSVVACWPESTFTTGNHIDPGCTFVVQ